MDCLYSDKFYELYNEFIAALYKQISNRVNAVININVSILNIHPQERTKF